MRPQTNGDVPAAPLPSGIAKGIRRIVAFTGEDAVRAIAEGNRLAGQIEAAKALPDAELDKVLSAIKQVRGSFRLLTYSLLGFFIWVCALRHGSGAFHCGIPCSHMCTH